MSHGSGIELTESLIEVFNNANANTQKVRFIKAQIEDDKIVSKEIIQGTDNWENDLDLVLDYLLESDPCYILYRRDENVDTGNGYKWMLFSYIPERSKVRSKMLYSSTKHAFKTTLGGNFFSHEIHGTTKSDFGKSGFEEYMRHFNAAAPLTTAEEEKEAEMLISAHEMGAAPTGMATVSAGKGISFPIESQVNDAVNQLKSNGENNYVRINIDVAGEKIVLGEASHVELEQLTTKIPIDVPAFHFYRWDHNHEGKDLNTILFIFSCPDGSAGTKSAPVRQRMLYSSSKGTVENILLGIDGQIGLKLEINIPKEVEASVITEKVHPPPEEKKKTFAKPRPIGRKK